MKSNLKFYISFFHLKFTFFLMLIACSVTRADEFKPSGRLVHEALKESSGFIKSKQFSNVFWTHNDSGDTTRLFAVTATGETIREYFVKDAHCVDWEDITIDDENNLYIADVGNNLRQRNDLTIYKIPEPDPHKPTSEAVATELMMISYPEGNFDCEALFWRQGKLYLISKGREGSPALYRLNIWKAGLKQTLEKIGTLPIKGLISAADYSKEQHALAVLSYRTLWIFDEAIFRDATIKPLKTIIVAMKQCEGISWDGEKLQVSSEQRDLYEIPKSFWMNSSELIPILPNTEIRRLKKVKIDGNLKEWKKKYRLPMKAHANRAIPEVKFYAGWNEKGLYFAVQVFADSLYRAAPDKFYEGDCLLLLIDTQNKKSRWYLPSIYHYWTAFVDSLESSETYAGRWKHESDGLEGSIFDVKEIQSAGIISDESYTLELFVSADIFSVEKMNPKIEFGFNAQIWMPSYGNAEYSWSYSSTEYYSFDKPYLWGTAILKK